VHLCHLMADIERTRGLIRRTKALIAAAKPTEASKEARVTDDYEGKLLVAVRVMEILSTGGFSCELRHVASLH